MSTVSLTISGLDPEEAAKLLALLNGEADDDDEEEAKSSKKSKSKKESKKSKSKDDDEDEDDDDDDDEDDDDDDDEDDDDDDDEDDDDEDDEDEDEHTKESLKKLDKSEVIDIAKGMKLRKLDGLKKPELIDKILKAQARKKG
jgi:hypothetical protein